MKSRNIMKLDYQLSNSREQIENFVDQLWLYSKATNLQSKNINFQQVHAAGNIVVSSISPLAAT